MNQERKDLYCKIFVNTELRSNKEIADIISSEMKGKSSDWNVKTNLAEIYVDDNDDFDLERAQLKDRKSFLFFPFYLDIDPLEGVSSMRVQSWY